MKRNPSDRYDVRIEGLPTEIESAVRGTDCETFTHREKGGETDWFAGRFE